MRVLITGANRGIGFTKQLLDRGEAVIATYRNPEAAEKLHELKERYGEALLIYELDVSS